MKNSDNQLKTAAILVAAGQGMRMGTAVRKQYMLLAGLPVLYRTMLPFDRCEMINEIFLVVAGDDQDTCQKEVIDRCRWEKPVHMVKGGETRQESVFRGLEATGGRFGLVVIHDGVRPLIDDETICATIRAAFSCGAAVTAIPSHDTVKTVREGDFVLSTLDRTTIRLAQTPQAFRFDIIYKAHIAARKMRYGGTDDSALVERQGIPVKMVPGSSNNVKITTRGDLMFAEALIKTVQEPGDGNK